MDVKNMVSMTVDLNDINRVKEFAKKALNCEGDVLVNSIDRVYAIDGKSILGLFSLDTSKPVIVNYHKDDLDFEDYLKTIQCK